MHKRENEILKGEKLDLSRYLETSKKEKKRALRFKQSGYQPNSVPYYMNKVIQQLGQSPNEEIRYAYRLFPLFLVWNRRLDNKVDAIYQNEIQCRQRHITSKEK